VGEFERAVETGHCDGSLGDFNTPLFDETGVRENGTASGEAREVKASSSHPFIVSEALPEKVAGEREYRIHAGAEAI